MKNGTICKWTTGDIMMGFTAFYLVQLKNSKYAVSEASAMAMNQYERLGLFADLNKAVEFFGRCTAKFQ